MKISLSVEGKTDEWNGPTGEPVVRVLGRDGTTIDETLNASQLLSQVANLVPDGTKIRVTVETLD